MDRSTQIHCEHAGANSFCVVQLVPAPAGSGAAKLELAAYRRRWLPTISTREVQAIGIEHENSCIVRPRPSFCSRRELPARSQGEETHRGRRASAACGARPREVNAGGVRQRQLHCQLTAFAPDIVFNLSNRFITTVRLEAQYSGTARADERCATPEARPGRAAALQTKRPAKEGSRLSSTCDCRICGSIAPTGCATCGVSFIRHWLCEAGL